MFRESVRAAMHAVIIAFVVFVINSGYISMIPECQYTTKETRGVISTPNFPNPYPVPIDCQWVIEAPADKVIAVYFTQFYMREGLKATEFAYYSQNVKMGKTEFGTISSELEPTYLVSNKPVLVLDFSVRREMANIHMRVREYLLDVFGFNITYEMIARNESVRKDACLYHHCSFTGNCYSSGTYDRYYCKCFSEYFGNECQYDTECGPASSKTICQNGGTCRYYIGSTVRTCECPPGYDGARCETKRSSRPKELGCVGPGCNNNCSSLTNTTSKNCNVPFDKYRYIISLQLTNPKSSIVLSERKKLENFKKDMEKALQLLFKSRVDTENITMLEFRSDSVMKFHMLASKMEEEEIKSTIDGMLKLGKLGIFDFDQNFYESMREPALHIDRLEASETMPIVEGQELTLACMVKGSESLHVEWFKDGVPIYVHTAHRGMWTTVVPKNSQQQYTALLGFDRATSLDTGLFTCVVSDWGFVQNKSTQISVLSAPQPQLTPMAATIFRGEQFVITCLSREDLYGTYGYTWLKNDQIINPITDSEMIEDLFPAGSRILLMSAQSSATYTCIITSSAGSTRKDTVLTVLEGGMSIPTCPSEDYMKVRWNLAASNTEDRQLCPVGYTGDVRRKCSISNNRGAFWKDPDFSECFTTSFISLKKKVESLKLGYLLTDATSLLRKLKSYLTSRKRKMNVCEGEAVVDILEDIYNVEHAEKESKDGWLIFLDIASVLLESPRLIRKHEKIIQLYEQIFKYGFDYAESSNDVGFESFRRKYLAVEIGKIPDARPEVLKFPVQRLSRSTKVPDESSDSASWTANSVELELPRIEFEDSEANSTDSVAVVFYKNLSPYLPQRFVEKKGSSDIEYQLISSLIEVRLKGQSFTENGKKIGIKVKLANFNYTVDNHIGWNITCAMTDFSQGRIMFSTSDCQLLWTANNVTLCSCEKLGTYALLLTHYTLPEKDEDKSGFEVIAGIGCTVCAFFLLITFALLLSVWRRVRRAITVVKLQVCAALIGAYITFFCGVNHLFSEELFPYVVTVIQFFLLSSFTLQLCLALLVYIECIDLRNIPYSSTKIAALGWTLPVIVIGATLAAQSLDGFKLVRWWLQFGSTFFYSYTASIIILSMFQVLLFLTVKTEIRNHGKVADFLHKKKARVNTHRIKLLHRSLLLTALLLLVSVSSVLYVNFDNKIYKYFFAATSSLLGFIVFLSYTFCSEKHFILCCMDEATPECTEPEISSLESRNNSFKSFLKPEIIDDAYSSKLHQEAEKRSARIRRMYSQIEKASINKSGNPYAPEVTADLLAHHHQHPDISSDSPFRPPVLSSESIDDTILSRRIAESDAFFNPQSDTSGYPRMQWRYASHPHGFTDSPGSHRIHHPGSIQRPLLLESDSEHQDSRSVGIGSTFTNPGHTIKADIVTLRSSQLSVGALPSSFSTFSDTSLTDASEERGSIKNTCFARHTDSLETVVYCDDAGRSGTSHEPSEPKHGPTWNMTSV